MVNPARKIRNSGTKKNIGLFASYKMRTGIWFESLIERDYMYLLEIDPDVKSYQSQPLKLIYTLNDKSLLYTPDFLVERQNKQQLVEIKPARALHSDKNQELFRRIAPLCKKQGWEFVVVTDEMIRVQPLLDNLRLVYKYAREPITFNKYIDCYQYFQERFSTSLQTAIQDLSHKQISQKTLLKLMFLGILETDMMKRISSESLITWTQGQLALPEGLISCYAAILYNVKIRKIRDLENYASQKPSVSRTERKTDRTFKRSRSSLY